MDVHDEVVGQERLMKLHGCACRRGWKALMNDVMEREPSVVAYALHAALGVREELLAIGVPVQRARQIEIEMVSRMLVLAEAMREGTSELWSSFIDGERDEHQPGE